MALRKNKGQSCGSSGDVGMETSQKDRAATLTLIYTHMLPRTRYHAHATTHTLPRTRYHAQAVRHMSTILYVAPSTYPPLPRRFLLSVQVSYCRRSGCLGFFPRGFERATHLV